MAKPRRSRSLRRRAEPFVPDPAAEASAQRIAVMLTRGLIEQAHAEIDRFRALSAPRRRLSPEAWLEEPIVSLPDLPVRIANSLEKHAGIIFVRQLMQRFPTEASFRAEPIRGMGPGYFSELQRALRRVGIAWPPVPNQVPRTDRIAFDLDPAVYQLRSAPRAPAIPGRDIPATPRHDAGAMAQCSHCRRYTLNPNAIADPTWPCECGRAGHWTGSFSPPDENSQWSQARQSQFNPAFSLTAKDTP